MKICSICKIEKDLSFFSKDKSKKDGHRSACKDCMKIYRENNKNYFSEYYQNNRDTITEYKKNYYENNKEEILQRVEDYQKDNADKIASYQKEYKKDNMEELTSYIREYKKTRYANDPVFKIRNIVSNQIFLGLARNNNSKNGKSVWSFLPYSLTELKDHLEKQFEPWMNWENWGLYRSDIWNDNDPSTWTWQIDHIIPHSRFMYSSMEDQEFQECWALNNLRPYSAKQNLIDRDRK